MSAATGADTASRSVRSNAGIRMNPIAGVKSYADPKASDSNGCTVGQARKVETQAVKTNLTQGAVLMDDIQVPAGFAFGPEFTYTTKLWPDGEVPYVFDTNVNEHGQNAMPAAMAARS